MQGYFHYFIAEAVIAISVFPWLFLLWAFPASTAILSVYVFGIPWPNWIGFAVCIISWTSIYVLVGAKVAKGYKSKALSVQ